MIKSLRKAFAFMHGNMLVMTVTGAMGMFARSMVFPYASLYILALGGEPAQIGFVNSLRPLAGLIAFPIAGYLADRVSRVKVIGFTGYFSGAILLLYVLAPNWHFIALAGLLQGVGVLQFPASSAIIADSLSPETRAMGIATMNSIAGLLAVVAPYVAGLTIDILGVAAGIRLLYAVLMIVYLASAAINLRYLEDTSPHDAERVKLADLPQTVKDAYKDVPDILRNLPRSLSVLAAILILGYMANAIAGPFWVVYASQEIGLSSVQWGLVLFIETALRNLIYIPAGMVVDRSGRSRCIRISLFASLVVIPLFIVSKTFFHVLLIRSVVGITNAFFIPACSALMADLVPRDLRGRVMAALGRGSLMIGASSGGIGGPGVGFLITVPIMLASLAGGYLYDGDPAYPWFFVLAATLISLLLSVFFIRDPREAEA
ncbi:MAG: MFS transporter [Chloroflexota bacterium]|nr:MFS transporter [Chloroflexota bacterium]